MTISRGTRTRGAHAPSRVPFGASPKDPGKSVRWRRGRHGLRGRAVPPGTSRLYTELITMEDSNKISTKEVSIPDRADDRRRFRDHALFFMVMAGAVKIENDAGTPSFPALRRQPTAPISSTNRSSPFPHRRSEPERWSRSDLPKSTDLPRLKATLMRFKRKTPMPPRRPRS